MSEAVDSELRCETAVARAADCHESSAVLDDQFIENNDDLPEQINDDLLNAIISLHSINSANYGFDFDTQIGGDKIKCNSCPKENTDNISCLL